MLLCDRPRRAHARGIPERGADHTPDRCVKRIVKDGLTADLHLRRVAADLPPQLLQDVWSVAPDTPFSLDPHPLPKEGRGIRTKGTTFVTTATSVTCFACASSTGGCACPGRAQAPPGQTQ